MQPETSDANVTFLKLNDAFNEIFGTPGNVSWREPGGPQYLYPLLGVARRELTGRKDS